MLRERLYEDVDIARTRLREFTAQREARLEAILRVEDMYFGDSAIEPLSEVDCTFLAYSHLITFPPTEAPSITEAFSGGRIDLVTRRSVSQ
ncbi:MAG: hypothetical protein AAF184_13495 [Pseudomonadota bacterium]